MVFCDVVVAELAAGVGSRTALEQALEELGLTSESLTMEAAHAAGRAFAAYRREGGPREHLTPDFLIGAHAQVQAERLAVRDRGYLRRYFAGLTILSA